MTLTISPPRGPAIARTTRPMRTTARRPRLSRREQLELEAARRLKIVETGRITLCCGCHMIGWYPADALAEVLADLKRWATDPSARDHLPWPVCCAPWEWAPGEALALWRGGRLLALVAKRAAGEPVVTRFDAAAAAE